jgi:hypothetical protein
MRLTELRREEGDLVRSVKAVWSVGLTLLLTAGIACAAVRSSDLVPPPAWQRAAAKLEMPVFWPTETFGTTLTQVVPQHVPCGGPVREQLYANYAGAPGGDAQRPWGLTEGRPGYCGNPGESALLGRPLIHGIRAILTCDVVTNNHCSAQTKAYPNVAWRERGVAIWMSGLPRKELLAAAESMQPIL